MRTEELKMGREHKNWVTLLTTCVVPCVNRQVLSSRMGPVGCIASRGRIQMGENLCYNEDYDMDAWDGLRYA